jgi:hypothetical protein
MPHAVSSAFSIFALNVTSVTGCCEPLRHTHFFGKTAIAPFSSRWSSGNGDKN